MYQWTAQGVSTHTRPLAKEEAGITCSFYNIKVYKLIPLVQLLVLWVCAEIFCFSASVLRESKLKKNSQKSQGCWNSNINFKQNVLKC